MRFWKDKALAEELRESKVTKGESDLYLVVFIAELLLPIVLYALGMVVANRVAAVAVIGATALGIYLSRVAVRNGDGKDFFQRFSTLAVPILFRLYFFMGIFYLAVQLVFPRLLTHGWFSVLFWLALPVLFFRKMNFLLRWVAELKPSFIARQGI